MWLDPDPYWRDLIKHVLQLPKDNSVVTLIAAVVGGTFAVFAAGFVIGTMTIVLLRLAFVFSWFLCGRRTHTQYEVALSKEDLRTLWVRLNCERVPHVQELATQELYLGVTFDYTVVAENRKGVHDWMERRWTAFNLNSMSTTALVLSVITIRILGIQFSLWWLVLVLITIFCLIMAACWAWRDTMGMLHFQANMPWPEEPRHGAGAHALFSSSGQ